MPRGRRRAVIEPLQLRAGRLDPDVFDLPVEKMREGYYTDAYFNHTRATLLADGHQPRVVMQIFQRKHAMLGGMDEAIAVLKLCSHDWEALDVWALHDGDRIEPWETVMTIEGDYTLFAHLETVYLGVLARRTLISTNTERVLLAANGKPIIFMPARHDHHRVQTGDGYAAYVAGVVLGRETASPRMHRRPGGAASASARSHTRSSPPMTETRSWPRASSPNGPTQPPHHRARRLRERLVSTALAVADALGPKLWACGSTRRATRRPLPLGRVVTSIHAA